ncbi:MAG: zinc dependent phospholipase C family protein [Deltaproteobacteria bacterium]|nr:zinc dependent phospholipase C family protein [Deltaproteobacteria bacterium]
MFTRLALSILLVAAGATPAFGYALNAHVAICQHVLDTLSGKATALQKHGVPDLTPSKANVHDNGSPDPTQGVVAGRAAKGALKSIQPNPEIKRIILAHPAAFRAGCGAPDAFPFFGNTDPSHSYGWDPIGIAETLLKNASSDEEKAWVAGYFSHLAMDGAVHAFANTYAGLSMKRHGALTGTLRPQVWDTFQPSNFLAHVAAETWLNNYYVYAAKPDNHRIETPKDFARRMFLAPGSPIVRHFSAILDRWSPEEKIKRGSAFDLKTDISGEKPGVLGTYFQRALQHLHKYEDLHTEQMYRWLGHTRFYEKKDGTGDRFKYYLSATLHAWHQGRVTKIRNIHKAWLDGTIEMQTIVSSRGSPVALAKAVLAVKKAVSEYLAIGLVDALRLPPPLQSALDSFRGFMDQIDAIVKVIVTEVVRAAITPFLDQIAEIARVASGEMLDKFMDRSARDHARKLLAEAGLVPNVEASEPGALAATTAGIDGASAQENEKNRQRLLSYPFYRNAWMAVHHVLRDLKSVKNLPSADFTNGWRCADFFQKTRGHADEKYTAIVKGDDPLYNATTEICHTPNLTRVDDTAYIEIDFDKQYAHLANTSKGFLEFTEVRAMIERIADAVGSAGSWLWKRLEPVLPTSIASALSMLSAAGAALGKLIEAIDGPPGTMTAKVKAFVLKMINAHLPSFEQCVDDNELSKAVGLRAFKTCELAEAFLKEKCTAPFLNTVFESLLPVTARPAEMKIIEQPGALNALKGVQISLDKTTVVIPAEDTHRPSVSVEMSLSKDGEASAMRFGATVAARVRTKCGKGDSAFQIRPVLDDISVDWPPMWLLSTVGKLAVETVTFRAWKPEMNKWWVTKSAATATPKPKPSKPAKPEHKCSVTFGEEGGN